MVDFRQLAPGSQASSSCPVGAGRIGTALMRRAVKEAAALGVRELFLYTSTARRLYGRSVYSAMRSAASRCRNSTVIGSVVAWRTKRRRSDSKR